MGQVVTALLVVNMGQQVCGTVVRPVVPETFIAIHLQSRIPYSACLAERIVLASLAYNIVIHHIQIAVEVVVEQVGKV